MLRNMPTLPLFTKFSIIFIHFWRFLLKFFYQYLFIFGKFSKTKIHKILIISNFILESFYKKFHKVSFIFNENSKSVLMENSLIFIAHFSQSSTFQHLILNRLKIDPKILSILHILRAIKASLRNLFDTQKQLLIIILKIVKFLIRYNSSMAFITKPL